MRKQTINIYNFEELSESAQETAINESRYNIDYAWHNDNMKTLESFCNIFNIKIKDYSFSSSYCNIDFEINHDENILELEGLRLKKYIINNYYNSLYKGKYFSKNYYKNEIFILKQRYSKIIMDNCCVLTGYCMDDDILQNIYDFINNKKDFGNFEDLLKSCIENFEIAVKNDYEACESDDYIKDYLISNEYEFTENGVIY